MIDSIVQGLLDDFHAGSSVRAYDLLGAHKSYMFGQLGVVFRVWARYNVPGVRPNRRFPRKLFPTPLLR